MVVLMQTLRLEDCLIALRYNSTDGLHHHDDSSDDEDSPYQLLRGPSAAMLDVRFPRFVDIELAYRPLYSPGIPQACARQMLAHLPACAASLHPVSTCLAIDDHGLLLSNPVAIAAGAMLGWEGRGTRIAPGFAALRIQSWWIFLRATERLLPGSQGDGGRCMNSPAHLLCRALRMAPPSYRRFELAAHQRPSIIVRGALSTGTQDTTYCACRAVFDNATDLAAAMQPFVSAEHLSVEVSADELSIVVHKVGSERLVAGAQV